MTSSASRAVPGVYASTSIGDERSILKPNRSRRVAIRRMSVASSVVGLAGCDSVESSDVVTRLLVAERRGFFMSPGYACLAKRACAHPRLLPVASFAARSNEGQHWGIALWGSGREAFAVDGSERGSAESACGLPGPLITSPSPPPPIRGAREVRPRSSSRGVSSALIGKCVLGALCGVAPDLPIRY